MWAIGSIKEDYLGYELGPLSCRQTDNRLTNASIVASKTNAPSMEPCSAPFASNVFKPLEAVVAFSVTI